LPEQKVFQLCIELTGITPVVWRRLLVPGEVLLGALHEMIQESMGWTDAHPHCFTIGDQTYVMLDEDDDPEDEDLDENETTVADAIGDHQRFGYTYDFGDDWDHTIGVENITTPLPPLRFSVCLGGEGGCPPEDSGGPFGYRRLIEEERCKPVAFDIAAVNATLQLIR
jgi:hypothetical protein